MKENVRKRPLDGPQGLGRQGAVRKRKDEVHEQNGHKFVSQQFYQLMLCAFCNDFLLNAVGYQCEDCRYTCHKKCYEKVVTKCISKSNTGVCLCLIVVLSLLISEFFFRRATRRRSTIVFPIGSSLSPILELTGVAIVDTCSPSAGRMPVNARNVTLLVTQIVPI